MRPLATGTVATCLTCAQQQWPENGVMEIRRQDAELVDERVTLASVVQENRRLVKNIRDAEAALITLAR